VIQRIYRAKEVLRANIKIAYLENYNMEIGKLMTAVSMSGSIHRNRRSKLREPAA